MKLGLQSTLIRFLLVYFQNVMFALRHYILDVSWFQLYRNTQLIVCLESQKILDIFVGKSVEPRASWILDNHSIIELHPRTELCLQLWNLDFGRILVLLGLWIIVKLNWIHFYIMRWAVWPGMGYYNLNIKCLSQTHVFEHLVLTWWHCFRML